MITEDKLKHIMGVARRCAAIAEDLGLSEEDCKLAFCIGYLHDIGYEYCKSSDEHPVLGKEMIELIYKNADLISYCIENHGNPDCRQEDMLGILNYADMSVSPKGEVVTFEERLRDIKARHGENSPAYINSSSIVKELLKVY